MHYALLLNNAEPAEGEVPEEAMLQMQQAMADYTAALQAAGVLIGAEILEPQAQTVTVTRRDGDLRIEDGPFADTREALTAFAQEGEDALAQAFPEAERSPGALRLAVPRAGKLAALARVGAAQAWLADVDIQPPSLEDIYARISRRDLPAQEVAASPQPM